MFILSGPEKLNEAKVKSTLSKAFLLCFRCSFYQRHKFQMISDISYLLSNFFPLSCSTLITIETSPLWGLKVTKAVKKSREMFGGKKFTRQRRGRPEDFSQIKEKKSFLFIKDENENKGRKTKELGQFISPHTIYHPIHFHLTYIRESFLI